jgi:succinyl-CoA synthetase beta subunit
MKLLEYKAKELFDRYGLPTMKGTVIDTKDGVAEKIAGAGLTYPVVLKAQVQIGGRGKAGGIQFAENGKEAQDKADKLLFTQLKGFDVNKLLVVEKAGLKTEWYLSIMLDRLSKCPLIIFSAMGGMDIEETARTNPEKIVKAEINPVLGVQDYTVRYVIQKSGIGMEHFDRLKDILSKLCRLFMEYSCMLAEINPLGLNDAGEIIALDGKVDIDDSALYRLPDILEFRNSLQEDPLVVEARKFNFLYIPIEEGGNIAVVSNGSGMLMSCIDLISKKGMKVGAALDLGGGATAERIKEAIRIILSNKDIDTLFISIFGGITRCDEVAAGVKLAMEAQDGKKKVYMRIEGTNKEKGLTIIKTVKGVTAVDGIPEGVEALYKGRC